MNLRPLNKQSSMPTTTPSITLCALANPMQTCQHPITVPLFQTNVKTPHATLIKSDPWEIKENETHESVSSDDFISFLFCFSKKSLLFRTQISAWKEPTQSTLQQIWFRGGEHFYGCMPKSAVKLNNNNCPETTLEILHSKQLFFSHRFYFIKYEKIKQKD